MFLILNKIVYTLLSHLFYFSSGSRIVEIFLKFLKTLIFRKISGITLDHAPVNSTIIVELGYLLVNEEIGFDITDSHFR